MIDKAAGVLTADMIYRAMESLAAPRCHVCGGRVEHGKYGHDDCLDRQRAFDDYLADRIEQSHGRPMN